MLYTSVIPALGRQRKPEHCKFQASHSFTPEEGGEKEGQQQVFLKLEVARPGDMSLLSHRLRKLRQGIFVFVFLCCLLSFEI